jgi:spore coat polysaccharide biosynthesis protein SpsF (cytidylyltransferase family)
MITLIQARSTSTRLPGKWKTMLAGHNLLDRCYASCFEASDLVVVIAPWGDNELQSHCHSHGYLYLEGPEDDVLTRFYQASCCFPKENWFARITADCSMVSTSELYWMGHQAQKHNIDFSSNCVLDHREGMEIEILSRRALMWVNAHAKANGHREHVTTYIKEHLEAFSHAGMTLRLHREPYLSEWLPKKLSIDTKLDAEHMQETWKKWCALSK